MSTITKLGISKIDRSGATDTEQRQASFDFVQEISGQHRAMAKASVAATTAATTYTPPAIQAAPKIPEGTPVTETAAKRPVTPLNIRQLSAHLDALIEKNKTREVELYQTVYLEAEDLDRFTNADYRAIMKMMDKYEDVVKLKARDPATRKLFRERIDLAMKDQKPVKQELRLGSISILQTGNHLPLHSEVSATGAHWSPVAPKEKRAMTEPATTTVPAKPRKLHVYQPVPDDNVQPAANSAIIPMPPPAEPQSVWKRMKGMASGVKRLFA
ncbi:MAG: hypothetical protein JWM56_138 [Candidatus Peribacteria bacterium]|nr:hypothetical protein [Candidatus Peribacteria bacterium]